MSRRPAPVGEAAARPRPSGSWPLVLLYTLTVFAGAGLLFLVEPMVAKMLLPLLGGTADVWNTAVVFFQAVLLGGYAFAHATLSRLGVPRQRLVQVACLFVPFLVLPVAVPSGWQPPIGLSPVLWTLLVLTVMVGGPFFMLSTAGPTLQRWFSTTGHPHAADPYFLYAAGNVGSLLALVSYPLVFERWLSTTDQSRLWSAGYALFVAGSISCALVLRKAPVVTATGSDSDGSAAVAAPVGRTITARTRARWIALAAIPSSLLLGVTRHIATDVASMPLFWIIPLSLYLLTFVVVFGRDPVPVVRIAARALKLLVIPLALSFFGLTGSLWISLGLHLAVFVAAALVAHGQLAGERPGPAELTEFYLLLSLGGVVGGILTALVAPLVFTTVLEYPIAIVASLLVLPLSAFPAGPAGRRDGARQLALGAAVGGLALAAVVIRAGGTQQDLVFSMLAGAAGATVAYALARGPIEFAASIGVLLLAAVAVPAQPTLHQQRTFFGVHRVYEDPLVPGRHVLLSGTTVHGMEDTQGPHAGEPTTYYHHTGPVGQLFAALDSQEPGPRDVGLIGLGSGAMSAYGRPGDHFVYHEIDQAVIDIARDPSLFTFVSGSQAATEFRLGDGRLVLAADHDARYDVLVVDAFTGDAIPVHLLTTEALALYRERLTDDGILVFHISNRYFDFAPVLARLAAEHGLHALIQDDPPTAAEAEEGKLQSTWVAMAPTADALDPLASTGPWQPLVAAPDDPLWTDDHTDLLGVLGRS